MMGFQISENPHVQPNRQYGGGEEHLCRLHMGRGERVLLSRYNPYCICSACQDELAAKEQERRLTLGDGADYSKPVAVVLKDYIR